MALKTPTYTKHRERHEREGIFALKAKPGVGVCMVRGCRKNVGKHKFSLCHAHYQHRWRMLNKKQSAYAALRDHAKQRGLEFNLSTDYFLGLTDAFAYWDSNAENFGDYPSIDRIDGSKGYVMGNIRVISVSQNSRKSAREKFLPSMVQALLERKRARALENPFIRDENACPF